MASSTIRTLPGSRRLPGSRELALEREFARLRAESDRLRQEFLRCEMEISHTIATFAGARPDSDVLRAACHRTALKGYETILKLLARERTPGMGASLPEISLNSLRADLRKLESAGPARPAKATVPAPAATGAGKNGRRKPARTDGLTGREVEVLRCIAEGKSTKQVAGILAISFKTAACHRYRVMDKLGIHETANLVRYAIRQGIVRA